MQNKTTLLIALQTGCLVVFLMAALACQTYTPVVRDTERAAHSECQSGDYLYIGKHSTQSEAESVARSKGLNDACPNEQNKGSYFAK